MFVGSYIGGWVVDLYAGVGGDPARHDWTSIWLVPAAMAIGVLILFALFFRPQTNEQRAASTAAEPA
jgi:Nucleoside H+ symporter